MKSSALWNGYGQSQVEGIGTTQMDMLQVAE